MAISFPIATAVREVLKEGYSWQIARQDILAGVTLGIIAVPLAMALAIASGVPPQYGLYTSLIAGALIALTGGSRLAVSGPTAAFVVILLPVTQTHGLGGLLLATLMAGILLLLMGITGLGRLVQYIPAPVTLGFTAGIGVVIATLQLQDFLGLQISEQGEHYAEKLTHLIQALPSIHWPDMLVGCLVLTTLALWPRLKLALPGHLPALLLGVCTAYALQLSGWQVATLGSEFSYTLADGTQGQGIPPVLPSFAWPWQLPNAQGEPLGLSWALIQDLLPSAFTIALLGAIESLLCALVADSLAGTRHNSNAELIGQGLGNLAAPFFGGITATGAIARTAANVRAGGKTPFAAVFHALFVLCALVFFAPALSYLPLSALAALLLMVAWNMSELPHLVRMLKVAPRYDLWVLITCFLLTILFDMVLAVSVGIVLAALLFMARMAQTTDVHKPQAITDLALPEHVGLYRFQGPLFFAAAEKVLGRLQRVHTPVPVLILDMHTVTSLDITAMDMLVPQLKHIQAEGTHLIICGLAPRLILKLRRAGLRKQGYLHFRRQLISARHLAISLLGDQGVHPT
ncbi:sulfate permease, SulP family [Allopseudospirillum japonicum]|uniref:Sulfate permease, SulP family n=1 Tax=Allopseudospirillum japonicum TaxID=64971 RepID=A0A1H6REE3_9GAMM|nr:C4-dicarboxylic acid transporter DauA [Allopseudospirillum japonicum]SEI52836.1 sulfate permease, SulP family [Allopseudospirillum japonicum]